MPADSTWDLTGRLKGQYSYIINTVPLVGAIKMSTLNRIVYDYVGVFCEKRLLAASCLSVRPHGTTRLPLDGFS